MKRTVLSLSIRAMFERPREHGQEIRPIIHHIPIIEFTPDVLRVLCRMWDSQKAA